MDNNTEYDNKEVDEEVSENERVTSLVNDRPLTIEEVGQHYKVDRKVWEVDHMITNVWQNASKDEQKDLTFDEGLVTGQVKTGGIVVTNLYQTKVWWVRIKPIALAPVLYPVDVTGFMFSTKAKTRKASDPSILVIPDLHLGYSRQDGENIPIHDKRAMNIVRELVRKYSFKHIIILGDLFDFAEWSDHFPTPNDLRDTTQDALVEGAAFLAEIRAEQPKAEIVYLEGNHEIRMRKLLIKLVPAAYGLRSVGNIEGFPAISIPGLLELDKLNIKWIAEYPSGEYWVDNIQFIHGKIARKSGLTSGHHVNTKDHSTVYGHTHRVETATRTVWAEGKKKEIFAISPGCLCRVDDSGVVPAVMTRNNWQQGTLLLTKLGDTWVKEQVSIQDGVGFYRGIEIRG